MKLLCLLTLCLLTSPNKAFWLNVESSNLQDASTATVDCEVRTLIFDDGDGNDSEHRRCVTYAANQDDPDDISNEMVYDLPQWIVDKYNDDFETKPSNYLRIHGARLSQHNPTPMTNQRLRSSSSNNNNNNNPRDKNLRDTEDAVVTDEDARVEISDAPFVKSSHQRRRTAEMTGMSSVLVVRVSTNDAAVDLDANTLSDRVFGSYGSPASQYKACSMGKKQLIPATGTHITDGVVEVAVNSAIQGMAVLDFENQINSVLEPMVANLESYGHIIYCVPPGTTGPSGNTNWKGYAYTNWNRAVFNNEKCGFLSHLAHELGHHMGLGHSGRSRFVYADRTGYMGYSYPEVQYPLMCFNGAKNWQLGWYDEKAIELSDRSTCGAWKGRLYAFPDFESVPNNEQSFVLIKINDLHIQFNKVVGMNKDSMDKKDLVTITRSDSIGAPVSQTMGGLEAGETFEDGDLRVDVCSKPTDNGLEYYDIVIRHESQPSICNQDYTSECSLASPPTSPQSPSPTQMPTLPPTQLSTTQAPTPPPSVSPTRAQPSTQPTSAPSNAAPSSDPTETPSVTQATFSPSTLSPTGSPSTLTPTFSPSTVSPTGAPSSILSSTPSSFVGGVQGFAPNTAAAPNAQVVPSAVTPNAVPLAPREPHKCADSVVETFPYVDEQQIVHEQTCAWLKTMPALQANLCSEDQPAYSACEETCGKCHASCHDTVGTFSFEGQERDCFWLSSNLEASDNLCKRSHVSYPTCPNTCGGCDIPIYYPGRFSFTGFHLAN